MDIFFIQPAGWTENIYQITLSLSTAWMEESLLSSYCILKAAGFEHE